MPTACTPYCPGKGAVTGTSKELPGVLSLAEGRATPFLNCQSATLAGEKMTNAIPPPRHFCLAQRPLVKGTSLRQYQKGGRTGDGRGHSRATHIVGSNILDGVLHSIIHYYHSHSSPSYIAFPYTCHVDVSAGALPVILQERQGPELSQSLGFQ